MGKNSHSIKSDSSKRVCVWIKGANSEIVKDTRDNKTRPGYQGIQMLIGFQYRIRKEKNIYQCF